MADPADYYREIYLRGLGGETPPVPVSIAELERAAVAAMEPRAANYVGAGAGSEDTIRANAEAFKAHRIVPRMLRDVSARDLSTTLLGTAMPAPLMLAPIGVQKVVHEEGELATARAAAAVGAPMIASTASHFTLEQIATAGGEGAPRWFQLYWANDRELVKSFVGRAERARYGAIVVTVDTFLPGWKPRDLQQAWLPFLEGSGNANYFQDPVFRAGLEQAPEEDQGAATGHYLGVLSNPALAWDDLAWLREQTSLPIVLKGIQHADDAREAADRGIDGIVVSNHGVARSTVPSPRSTPCPRSLQRQETDSRSSSTAESAPEPTSSRHWPWAPMRSASVAHTSGAWRSTGRPGSKPSSRRSSASST
jgi:lactate 2-monooxygenase